MTRLITIVFLFTSIVAFSQEPPQQQEQQKQEKTKAPFKDRLFLSPDLGLQFGTVTFINISPKIGYMLTDKLGAGVGVTYIYVNDKTYRSLGYTYESNIYGGSIFGQYQLFEAVQLYSEYQVLNMDAFDPISFEISRKNVPAWLVGGGYTTSIGANSSVGLMLLWDVIEDRNSFYSNPIIRIGFNFGL